MTDTPRLTKQELAAWVRLVAVTELLPGVLDAQLRRDEQLMHFEYYVLAMLSEAPQRTLQMRDLAARTNATLPRLSHVARRLEDRGLVIRTPCPLDRRATNASLTDAGLAAIRAAAPGHAATVREHVFDVLSAQQVGQLREITSAILSHLDPHQAMAPAYTRYDGNSPSKGSPTD